MRLKIIVVLFLLSTLAYSQTPQILPSELKTTLEGNDHEKIGLHFCGTPYLTEEMIQIAIENTRLYKPDVYESMLKRQLEKSIQTVMSDTVGTLNNFFVFNRVNNNFDEITAELRAKGTISQVWVDTTELGNAHVTQTEVDAMLKTLELQTPVGSRDPNKGIVELDIDLFGAPPNFDGDGISDFLVTDIKDGWTPGSNSSFTAGFFTSRDQTFGTGSNQRDILYIDSYPSIFRNDTRNITLALTTLAHEFQHLIHHHFDTNEITFLNEGFSHLAEAICGFGLTSPSPSQHFSKTDVPLFDYDNISGSQFIDRSRGGLFSLYTLEQLGDTIIEEIVRDRANGELGINNVFSQQSVGFDLRQFFAYFSLANYINDLTVNAKYGYTFPISGRPSEVFNHSDPNQDIKNQTVNNLAVDYVIYSLGDSLEVTFSSANVINISAIKIGTGPTQVEDVTVGAKYSVPEFGNTVKTVIFAIINLGTTRATYSYVSQGKQTGVLVETAYDDGTPDTFSGNAAFLGFGDNNKDFGWAVKFIPEVSNNTLMSAKILAAFNQEFSGSTTPANAPKEFMFHVWDNQNGMPGNDIITPFIVSTNRTGFSGREFLEIDLTDFESELTNLDTIYVGFTENDSLGTFVGMDNSTSTNFTYAFFGPTHPNIPNEWRPMSALTAGDVELSGWNMMMRANFSYRDDTRPSFVAGFFQNPIFTERLDVFVVGSAKLSANNLEVSLTKGADKKILNMKPVPNTDDMVFVDSNVIISSSGPITIDVQGTTKYGVITGDSTFTFNVQFMQSRTGGLLTAVDGKLELQIPEKSLANDIFLISMVGNASVTNSEIENSLPDKSGSVYTVSPVGYRLNKPAQLKLRYDPIELGSILPEDLTIAYWDADKWIALQSEVSKLDNTISAAISELGHYAIIPAGSVTEVQTQNAEVPSSFELHQNYPNPFNPSTSIRFDLPENSFVELIIYDLLGRRVRMLLKENKAPGVHQVTWDGRDDDGHLVNSGVFFYRIKANHFSKTIKMILIK